jgi:hypothetical protein
MLTILAFIFNSKAGLNVMEHAQLHQAGGGVLPLT